MMYEQDIDMDRHIIDRNLGFMDQHKAAYYGSHLAQQAKPTIEIQPGSAMKLNYREPQNRFCGTPLFKKNN